MQSQIHPIAFRNLYFQPIRAKIVRLISGCCHPRYWSGTL